METLWILVLVVGGAAITVVGLWKAYFDARRQVVKESWRISRTEELSQRERAELALVPTDNEHQPQREAIVAASTQRYEDDGLTRAMFANLSQLHQFESQRLVGDLLLGARWNFFVAGVGVLLGTAGSVWDILLP